MYFNKNLKHLRIKKKLSQTELANQLNVTRDTIASLENQRMNPSFELLLKIKYFFNINLENLIFKDLSNKE